jgi:cytochrome c-type biogenesis protein CcmF
VQGTKATVGAPFFNRVNIPIALFLLLLTGIGPLLAWRRTSLESLRHSFALPAAAALATAVALVIGGMRPWQDLSYFYALMSISMAVFVAVTVGSEFVRGARVIRSHTGMNLAAAMVQLTRRNTRRYGGYLVHFGVVVIIIGFAGSAFNQDKEQELGLGDKMSIGRYTLVSRSYTRDFQPNYESDYAILDVYRNGTFLQTMYPERRFFTASQQEATMVANRSTWREDLYLVYAGRNPDTDRPIIRAHLNPLVVWVWAGVYIVVFGTLVALAPNLQATAARHTAPATELAAVAAGARQGGD